MKAGQHIELLLGRKAKDRVTGFQGVITSICFDLYGCVQVVVTPPATKARDIPDGQWFDIARVEIKNGKPVMPVPNFDRGYIAAGKKGAATKSLP